MKTTGVDSSAPQLLSDVLALGQQLGDVISGLENMNECDGICTIVQKVKDEIEKYFRDRYGLSPQKDPYK